MEEGVSVPNLEAENTRQKSLFQKKENELPLPPEEKVPAVPVNEAVKGVLNKITRNFAAAQSRKKKKLESVDAPEEKKDYESVHSVEYPEKNKASKSVNVPEKKKWTYMVGDPEIDCKLAVGSVDNIVAHATIMESGDDPEAVIHGRPLGDDNRRVSVYYAIDEKAKVSFPVEDEIVTVKHAMGSWVAWPKDLIILPNEKPGVDKVSKKKRKRSELAVQMEEADVTLAELAPNLSRPYEMLCTAMKDGRELSSNIEPEVFGYICSSYITGNDVVVIATMEKVTGNLIASYQRYLYSKLEAYRMVDMVAFVHPSQIGAVGCGTGTQRTENIAKRLATAKPGQVFMLPYNSGDHWTLTVVDPDNDTVYFMDPVRRRIPCGDWAKIIKDAMVMANTARKRNGRSSMISKNLAGMPFQPSDKEYGYYVMGYMREIIEDKDTSRFVTKWDKRGSCKYTREYLDEVRNEWADFVVKKYVKEP